MDSMLGDLYTKINVKMVTCWAVSWLWLLLLATWPVVKILAKSATAPPKAVAAALAAEDRCEVEGVPPPIKGFST